MQIDVIQIAFLLNIDVQINSHFSKKIHINYYFFLSYWNDAFSAVIVDYKNCLSISCKYFYYNRNSCFARERCSLKRLIELCLSQCHDL